MKYLKQFLYKHKGKVVLNFTLILLQSVGTLLIPFLIAGIIDNGILQGNMEVILWYGLWMFIVAILSAGVAIGASWSAADFGAVFGKEMREELFIKSQELSLHQFNDVGLSSMVTRSTADISTMQATIGMVIQLILPAPLLILVSIFMTSQVSLYLALLLIVSLFVLILTSIWMLKMSVPLTSKIQVKLDRINQIVRENVTGIRVIRAFGNEKYEERRSSQAFNDYATTMIGLGRKFAIINPIVWTVMGLTMALILWIGSILAGNKMIEIGQITAVSEYVILSISYLIMATGIAVTLPKMKSCLDRLQEVLEKEPSIHEPNRPKTEEIEKAIISFDNVSFSYPGAEEAVLDKISFQCMPGETTAIIGGTGSGKSTIADLLLRLHDVSQGVIRYLGNDIKNMKQIELRNVIGCVPQKAFLFSGTIEQNLKMGNQHANREDLWEALRIAQAESFVENLPKQLNTHVAQGGTNFSGGQKQRLAIARALVRKADVYLFDDSFSALDVKTDAALRRALTGYGTEAAKIIIAQRVSTILNADQILVLDKGKLVGKGTHEELLKNCTLYLDIVRSQMEQREEE